MESTKTEPLEHKLVGYELLGSYDYNELGKLIFHHLELKPNTQGFNFDARNELKMSYISYALNEGEKIPLTLGFKLKRGKKANIKHKKLEA